MISAHFRFGAEGYVFENAQWSASIPSIGYGLDEARAPTFWPGLAQPIVLCE